MKNHNPKIFTPAFSMLELVMAIVVMGILAALAMPRMDRDRTQEAADYILSNIRYTQHMALSDYRQNAQNPNWQRSFWQIQFNSCNGDGMFIRLGADKDYGGSIGRTEAAIDSSTGLLMWWNTTLTCTNGGDNTVSPNIFISKKFGVKNVTPTGGCSVQHIGFDHLGRPHVSFSASSTPNYSSYMEDKCTFEFEVEGADDFKIEIAPETGYAKIVGQDNS